MTSVLKKIIDVIPGDHKSMKDKLIEKRSNVSDVPLPTKGSFTRRYYIVKNNFLSGEFSKLEYEVELVRNGNH